MNKHDAIELLGGSVSKAARAMRISASAVSQWPEDLPPLAVDRVQAALWRIEQAKQRANAEGQQEDRLNAA